MHVYVHVCVYVRVYGHLYICIYVYLCVWIYSHEWGVKRSTSDVVSLVLFTRLYEAEFLFNLQFFS